MKKLMFTAAVAAAMGAFAIESANVVGYTTKTIPAGKYMMIGVQFDTTAGAAMNADQAFKLDKAGHAWESADAPECIPNWYTTAPCIKIPYGTVNMGYRDLYYAEDACDADDNYALKPGWADQFGMLVKAPALLSGYGVWLVAGSEALTVTIAGQVKAAASDAITGGAGYNLMRLPYPVAINAGDSKINWNLSSQAGQAWESPDAPECIPNWFATAPCLKIPYGTVDQGYRDLYYAQDACDADDNYALKPGWADQFGMLVKNAVIPEGMGFWLVLPAANTATVTK